MNSILKGLARLHSSPTYKTYMILTSVHSEFKNTISSYNHLVLLTLGAPYHKSQNIHFCLVFKILSCFKFFLFSIPIKYLGAEWRWYVFGHRGGASRHYILLGLWVGCFFSGQWMSWVEVVLLGIYRAHHVITADVQGPCPSLYSQEAHILQPIWLQ